MIREVIATGKTVDAAIDLGCEKLGIDRNETDFEVEIIDMQSKGFLGIGAKPAKVRVYIETPDPVVVPEKKAEKPAAPVHTERKPAPVKKEKAAPKAETKPAAPKAAEAEAPAEEKRVYDLGNKPEVAAEYVKNILLAMGLDQITVTHTVKDNVLNIKLEGDVDALQYLAGLTANRGEGDYMRIVIDSGNYRDKRRGTLEQLAKKLANGVIKTGRSTTLEPMNPYERRIIHSTIAEIKGVTSASTGEEPNRCVVISSTEPKPQRSSENKGGKGGRGGRSGGGRRDDRRGGRGGRSGGGRREKPAPYQESSIREVPPAEAANQPLYGKIEL